MSCVLFSVLVACNHVEDVRVALKCRHIPALYPTELFKLGSRFFFFPFFFNLLSLYLIMCVFACDIVYNIFESLRVNPCMPLIYLTAKVLYPLAVCGNLFVNCGQVILVRTGTLVSILYLP